MTLCLRYTNSDIYIYIYIYVCVCVCVCVCVMGLLPTHWWSLPNHILIESQVFRGSVGRSVVVKLDRDSMFDWQVSQASPPLFFVSCYFNICLKLYRVPSYLFVVSNWVHINILGAYIVDGVPKINDISDNTIGN